MTTQLHDDGDNALDTDNNNNQLDTERAMLEPESSKPWLSVYANGQNTVMRKQVPSKIQNDHKWLSKGQRMDPSEVELTPMGSEIQIDKPSIDEKIANAKAMKNRKLTCCEIIKENLFLIWDGIGFFGTAHYKLLRCAGVPFKWWHRLYSPVQIVQWIIVIVLPLIIIAIEADEIGNHKFQMSDLIPKNKYTFPAHN